jgi:hypothetical protein
MARTPPGPSPDEIDLTDRAAPMVPMGANPDDAILRQIVESVAYDYDDPDIRAASNPRLELDRLRAAARELLRRADVASLAARTARHEEEQFTDSR